MPPSSRELGTSLDSSPDLGTAIIGNLRYRCPRCHAELGMSAGNNFACPACLSQYPARDGIASIMPPQEAGEVRAFFDSVAQCVSAEASSYVPYSAPVLDRQLSILSQAVRQTIRKWAIPKQSILDVGCGHGAMLAPLVDDYEITGIDFALAMLPVALQRGYAVCQGDARDLPFENEQFDIVVCAEAIQQFEDITAFVSEMARVCKWGGSVIVTTLNRTSLLRMALRFVSPALRATAFSVPVIRRRPADIIDLAAGAALTLGDIAWVLSPTQLVVYDARPTSLLGPFATNFILLLHKAYSPS